MNDVVLEWLSLAVGLVFFVGLFFLKKKHVNFGIRTLIATALGVVLGLLFPGHYTYIAAFGTIFSRVIASLVIPLLLFSIVASLTNLGNSIRLKAVGFKTVFFLLLNTFIAAAITLGASVLLQVGKGFNYELATDYEIKEVPTAIDTLVSLFPQNLANHWVSGQVVPIVIFLILVAIAYNKLASKDAEKVEPFKQFIDAGNAVMGKVVSIVISYTPYAVLSLIARQVSRSSLSELLPLLNILVLVYVLCAIQAFLVEGALLKWIGHVSPIQFFKDLWPAAVVAFTSQSSVATIPVNVAQLKEHGVNEDIASFGASLGANLGMPGCSGVWPVLLAVFAINVLGIPYTPIQYLFLIILAVVVSVGTVGVPGTATIVTTALFTAAGLPVEVIVLLAPISSVADMARTATNVIGAATATTLVAATEGQLNKK
ncbi:MAG: dicarboxylate/amino acid:cation symporter [Bacillota bacterium]|nr:dicarboxylate/amino acid:cation symporter [Bacillota bacterium]